METKNFKFNNDAKIRVLAELKNEMSWFVATDICEILGISDTRQAMERLDDDECKKEKILTAGQLRELWTVNEFGLYQLILSSDKPEAKVFKRWITHEVLPSIRITGKYTQHEIEHRDNQIKLLLDENKRFAERNETIMAEKKINERKIKDNEENIKKMLTSDFRQMKIDFNKSTEQVLI